MRVPTNTIVVAAALVALVAAAGCGDSNDTNIILGGGTTPTPGTRTATPARTHTPAAGATSTAAPTAGATSTAAATPSASGGATPSGSNPTPTASPSAISTDVQHITSDLIPFLTATSLLTGGAVSALTVANAAIGEPGTAEALKTDPCPDGGQRVDDEGLPTRTITLTACKVSATSLGAFQFGGTIVITLSSLSGGTIAFDFTATDLANSHAVHFSGTLTLTLSGGNFVLDGPLTIMTTEGNFTLTANQITVNSNRKLVSGSGTINDDSNNFTVQMISMVVAQGGQTADFTVTFDDTSVHTYTLDLQTGALTQNT